MDEYINKHKAYMMLKDLEATYLQYDVKEAYAKAARRIDQMPKADVQPVRHGRWVSEKVRKPDWKGMEHDYFQPNSCSVCHTGFAVRSNFCPNCGADMRGDTNGQMAKWIYDGDCMITSCCNTAYDINKFEHTDNIIYLPCVCPNCGARMDGDAQ